MRSITSTTITAGTIVSTVVVADVASAHTPESISPIAIGARPSCTARRHGESPARAHTRPTVKHRIEAGKKNATSTTSAPKVPAIR